MLRDLPISAIEDKINWSDLQLTSIKLVAISNPI